jgi:hypothetical protein
MMVNKPNTPYGNIRTQVGEPSGGKKNRLTRLRKPLIHSSYIGEFMLEVPINWGKELIIQWVLYPKLEWDKN